MSEWRAKLNLGVLAEVKPDSEHRSSFRFLKLKELLEMTPLLWASKPLAQASKPPTQASKPLPQASKPLQSCSFGLSVHVGLVARLGWRMAGPECVILESGV